ncbi:hypothetical protein [Candidatus Uabimicrobium amorphum]|uniref:Uncharacterized protein n=1 Tax=Uabimicrobium amorphum TaxID=2596890 RepID=A0A5S9IK53_UABAM|nr:hypothetical protein [Candidatus Uabimicrobium amorphum]BBM83027.1 hypothetical protein UABAM_01370 [Candidatus Uabimicrobium amorphum]
MSENASGKGKKIVLWVFSIVIMLSAFSYQKRTGPTYPYRGSYKIGDTEYYHKLIRSGDSQEDAVVELKAGEYAPSLFYKRFKTQDEFTQVLMEKKQENFVAFLPKQPAAGKLEYYLMMKAGDTKIRIPQNKEENIIIRFKDPVPEYILIPHILLMFFAMLVGMRAALGALFAPDSMRAFVWFSFVSMTIGGMILGPIVQKYAFGEYWTGFPWGGDWTDNKMLIMWVAWLAAISVVGLKAKSKELMSRIAVILAAIVMTAVYVIPHSIHGSELDYSKVDAGMDPAKAIKTGK